MDVPSRMRPPSSRPRTGRIAVQCLSCGREGALDPDDRRVAGRALVELTRHLVCSACGSRAVKAALVRTPRDLAARRGDDRAPTDRPDQRWDDLTIRVR